MTFTEALRSAAIHNYANFNGRAGRPEFWWFVLALVVASLIAGILDSMWFDGDEVIEGYLTLGTIIPALAVGSRRLHDIDRSGWWQLLQVLPLIGMIVLIVFWAQRGTAGPNRFGAPPLA